MKKIFLALLSTTISCLKINSDIPSMPFINPSGDEKYLSMESDYIFDQNILGGMCARVCPTETLCEEACVREAAEGKPVKIEPLINSTIPKIKENIKNELTIFFGFNAMKQKVTIP